jgi:hypothetical protein
MQRSLTHAAAIVLIATGLARAEGVTHPRAHAPDGGVPLPLAGQATRAHFLGSVDLYGLAVYAEGGRIDPAQLAAANAAKALRIEIAYKDDLRRRLPIDWRRELVPALESAAIASLRATFAPLQQGDVVLIEYVPNKGTSVRVNKSVAVSGINHDLMLAFLDHWLGQRPVSLEIKQALLSSGGD